MKKTRFNFRKDYKLYDACADDTLRPAMGMVHFMNDKAYASDSHIAVRVPLEACTTGLDQEQLQRLNGFSVYWKVLKKIYGYDHIWIDRDDEAGTCSICTELEGHEIRIDLKPQSELNVPNFDKIFNERKELEGVAKLGISPKMLARLGQSINVSSRVTMNIAGQRNAIYIKDIMSGAEAVIMPIMVNED